MRRPGRPRKVDHSRQADAFGGEPAGGAELGAPDPRSPVSNPKDVPYFSTSLVAACLQITDSAVRKLVADGLPKAGRNAFRIEDVTPWYLEHRARAPSADAETAREDYYRAQARRVTLDLRARESELVELAELEEILVEVWGATVSALEAAAIKVSRDQAERARAQEMIRDARTILEDRLSRLAARRERRATSAQAAAPTHGRRVGRPSPTAGRQG